MPKPANADAAKLKKLGKYLKNKRRSIIKFEYQKKPEYINVWVDSDYAGCAKTRKSASGGMTCFGRHLIKSWSTTQAVIALSSGEAEHYGIVKGSSIGLGLRALLDEFGVRDSRKIKMLTDASAAKGIAMRRGLGKVRHIEVTQLWVQEKVQAGEIEIIKVKTGENLADGMTKYIDSEKIRNQLIWTSQQIREGRHELMPAVV